MSEQPQNQIPANQPIPPPPVPAPPVYYTPPEPKPPRVYTKPEMWLLLGALAIGILLDRLFIRSVVCYGLFWLAYLAVFTFFMWPKLRQHKLLLLLEAGCILLCIWPIFFSQHEYAAFLCLSLPWGLMLLTQATALDVKPMEIWVAFVGLLMGWFVKPFSAIPHFFAILSRMGNKRKGLWQVVAGIFIGALLLTVIVPLLWQADQVFSFYLNRIFADFNIGTFFFHLFISVLFTMLFYSFLWNARFGENKKAAALPPGGGDVIITAIAVGVLLFVYVLFSVIQFAYLFAGAGLPEGMTYSEYARSGFWQLVAVCAINFAIFGWCQRLCKPHKVISGMMAGLLGATAVMLASALIRMGLYLQAYGMTWLRLLSLWFTLFLAAMLLFCITKMLWPKLPLISLAAGVLIAWFILLGYASPDRIIVEYNISRLDMAAGERFSPEDRMFHGNLSADALPSLVDYCRATGDDAMIALLRERLAQMEAPDNLSTRQAYAVLEEYLNA